MMNCKLLIYFSKDNTSSYYGCEDWFLFSVSRKDTSNICFIGLYGCFTLDKGKQRSNILHYLILGRTQIILHSP